MGKPRFPTCDKKEVSPTANFI